MNRRDALKAFLVLSIGWLQERDRNARIAAILDSVRFRLSNDPIVCCGPPLILDIDPD